MPDGRTDNPQLIALQTYLNGLDKDEGSLIVALQRAQELIGYLSEDAIFMVGQTLNIPVSKVYGVVTFYSFFRTRPRGKYDIKVCLGTACFVRKSPAILNELATLLQMEVGTTREDLKYSLNTVRCLGACGSAPIVQVNDDLYANVQVSDVAGIIRRYLD
ncbi:MAG: NAD(P)H-dependent oxidoreductase subunit E [Bacillota bacterium]|nr:NAD(P)H-dependent oxidoreductase subunit E [Bacillota bacterium]